MKYNVYTKPVGDTSVDINSIGNDDDFEASDILGVNLSNSSSFDDAVDFTISMKNP